MPLPRDRPIRVLLWSPLAGRDPPSGDISYTQSLLADPPPGVHYTTYADAIAAGDMRVRGRRPKHGEFDATDFLILAFRGMEAAVRGRVMFREPIWFATTKSSKFDLMHQHLFAVRQVTSRLPVVSSAGYPLSVLYEAREAWSQRKAARAEAWERRLARTLHAHTPGIWAPDRDVMTVYTERFREQLVGRHIEAGAILRCGQGLPPLEIGRSASAGPTLGFIGRDFEMKGGDVAVEAFVRMHAESPLLRLIVLTRPGAAAQRLLTVPGVQVVTDAPRDAVLKTFLPQMDVLLAPTFADCGAPFAILEALQAGVPVVTSTNPWLDDRLGEPAVRRVPAEAEAVARAAALLLDPGMRDVASAAARELWRQEFSMEHLHTELLCAYRTALRLHEKSG